MMLVEHTRDWVAALVMVGAIAAFMSTLDSQLLALSTILTRDFYLQIRGVRSGFRSEVNIGRIAVLLLTLIGLLIAFRPFDTIFDMGKISFAGLSLLFPTAFALILGKGVKPGYALASIIIGESLLLMSYYGWIPTAWFLGFESFIPILTITFAIVGMGMFPNRSFGQTSPQ